MISRGTIWVSNYSRKWLLAVMKALILDLNLLQALAMVSLSRNPTSTFIFWNRSPRFCCEALHWHITQKRPTQNCSKGCSQASWEAKPPSPTPPGGSPHWLAVVHCDELLWACGQDDQYAVAAPPAPFLFQQILQKQKICLTSFNSVLNSAPFDVFMLIISFTVSRREAWRLWQLS